MSKVILRLKLTIKVVILTLLPTDLRRQHVSEIVNVLTEMGFDVEASHHEVAVGQHEIDFKYTDVLKACDNIQIFKLVVKTIARKHGLYATFMAKPKYGIAGGGMHCNMSLFTEEGNAFFDPEDPRGMSNCLKTLTTSLVV